MILVWHNPEAYRSSPFGEMQDLSERIKSLSLLAAELGKFDQKLSKTDEVFEVEVAPGLLLWEILFDEGSPLSRDVRYELQTLLDRAKSIGRETVTQAVVVGGVGPYPVAGGSHVQSVADWRKLVRQQLKLSEWSEAEFVALCRKAFPTLTFGTKIPASLGGFEGGYSKHRVPIVDSLSALNDQLREALKDLNIKIGLKAFTAVSGFETTMEGDADRHPDLTFEFARDKKPSVNVRCEPHMKLSSSGVAGDTHFYQHRIYFSPSGHADFPGQILVGSVGKHQ